MGKSTKPLNITFANAQRAFRAGQKVEGWVHVHLKKQKEIRLNLTVYGGSKAKWTDSSDYRYRAQEEYMYERMVLHGSANSLQAHAAGDHNHPFTVDLPDSLPSSFEGNHGYVRYYCHAELEKDTWEELPASRSVLEYFTVVSNLDLNVEPVNLQNPMEGTSSVFPVCCCVKLGNITAKFQINKQAFVPGEKIEMSVSICNNSRCGLSSMTVAIKQYVDFLAYCQGLFSESKNATKNSSSEYVANMVSSDELLQGGKSLEWNPHLKVPAVPPSRLAGCQYINVAYVVKFHGVVEYGDNIKFVCPIIIGTVPYRSGNPAVTAALQRSRALNDDRKRLLCEDNTTAVPPGAESSTGSHIPMVPTVPPVDSPPDYEFVAAVSGGASGEEVPPRYPTPPPSYEESVFGRTNIVEEDQENMEPTSFAPVYPVYSLGSHVNPSTSGHAEDRV